jgi:transcriptional regulator with XRE-family HTH domain
MAKHVKTDSQQGIERAERIRYLRKLLDFSREKFAKRHGISPGSLQNWEDVRYGGLTENGAQQLLQAFQNEGLNCTLEWLLFGHGIAPQPRSLLDQFTTYPTYKTDEELLAEELQLFLNIHSNPVDARVMDDALAPYYVPGDHVAGEKLFNSSVEKAIGLPCIAQTQAGEVLLRIVQPGSQTGLYHLTSSNPAATVSNAFLADVKLFSAAPIIWIRKPRIR